MKGYKPYLTAVERTARNSAHMKVYRARRDGFVVPTPCQVDADLHVGPIHAHHRNGYERALDVVWLCAMHHGIEHAEMDQTRRVTQ